MIVAAAERPVAASRPMMGGRVSVHLLADGEPGEAEASAGRVLDRLEAWAGRLTRFAPSSELSRLNAAATGPVRVGPTLTAVLDWGRQAEADSDGIVDIALLDARLAAELGEPRGPVARRPSAAGPAGWSPSASRRWSLEREPRGAWVVREPGVRFDLDGVAKGWLADRALAIVPGRSALVDADGDIAARVAPGDEWAVGIADPRDEDARLAVLELRAGGERPRWFGIATSGTSVHRWRHGTRTSHHLIDPRTGRAADTDVVQATVLAASARDAEAAAKRAVILGADRAFAVLDRPGILGILLLTDPGDVLASPGMVRWLA